MTDLTGGEFWGPYWHGNPRYAQDVYRVVGEMWIGAWRHDDGTSCIECRPSEDDGSPPGKPEDVCAVLAMVRVRR